MPLLNVEDRRLVSLESSLFLLFSTNSDWRFWIWEDLRPLSFLLLVDVRSEDGEAEEGGSTAMVCPMNHQAVSLSSSSLGMSNK